MNRNNFPPMPKRFMVWDKVIEDWEKLGEQEVFELLDFRYLLHDGFIEYTSGNKIVVQSTNLFDKDGKEIFEGSIIRGKKYVYVVIFAYGGFYAIHDSAKVGYIETSLYRLLYHEGGAKVIGHILSNPELLEEE